MQLQPGKTIGTSVQTSRSSRGHSLRVEARSAGSTRDRSNGPGGDKGKRQSRMREVEGRGPTKLREYKNSDGVEHLGSAISQTTYRPFPGPPPDEGPPLRVLPIGGLGEIGMNCMMVGVRDRYIVVDAGLMFPDFSDLGMQKILPDTSFLHQWRDKIEALVITHGHEDHIGAMPWVVPALDPNTPIYASSFVLKLIKRRMEEYSLWNPERFKTIEMRKPFKAGPFEIEPIRVTHSIPDCCGLIMRSEEGTIVHTGDWKIDETPLDGEHFDRETFDALGKERVALFMSDSTNVLSPGRTLSEKVVHDSIVQKTLAHQGKGRVIITQFASNLARLHGVYAAAQASGRKVCFVGASLNLYLEAAWADGRAPFDPKELVDPVRLRDMNPNELLIVTTGSQAEPRAQLSLAAKDASHMLKIMPNDLLLYSAKVIPGNEPQVARLMNSLALLGAQVKQSRADNLHTSGHAYQDELKEVLRYVKPQHFLPVHGEYAFLTEHARLAREEAGVHSCSVIRNGQMLGIHEKPNRRTVSMGSMAAADVQRQKMFLSTTHGANASTISLSRDGTSEMTILGTTDLVLYYNDGNLGTGTAQDMALAERTTLALDGVVVVAVDVLRDGATDMLRGKVRLTVRGMWTDGGRLQRELHKGVTMIIERLPSTAPLPHVERTIVDGVGKMCKTFNQRRPEVIAICHEYDPRLSHIAEVAARRSGQRREASTGGRSAVREPGGATALRGRGVPEVASSTGVTSAGYPRVAVERLGSDASSDDELLLASSDEDIGEGPSSSGDGRERLSSMIEARKQSRGPSRASSKADGQSSSAGGEGAAARPRGRSKSSAPGLQEVPPEVLARRRAANPREAPQAAKDDDNAAYD